MPDAVHVARLPLALKSPSSTATDGQPYSTRPTIYALLHLARSVTAPSRRVDLIRCSSLADPEHRVKSLALSSVPRPVKQTLRLRLAPSAGTLLRVPVGNMPWRRAPVLVARAGSVSAHNPSISPVRLAEGHQPLTGVLSSGCSRRNNMAYHTQREIRVDVLHLPPACQKLGKRILHLGNLKSHLCDPFIRIFIATGTTIANGQILVKSTVSKGILLMLLLRSRFGWNDPPPHGGD